MSRDLKELEPIFRAKVEKLLSLAKAEGMNLLLVQGYRSSDEQMLIWMKGRTRPGEPCKHVSKPRPLGTCPIHPFGLTVSKARPGQSQHEAGRAADFCFQTASGISWDGPWERLGKLAESIGLKWGGRWRSPDRPHVEMPDARGIKVAIADHQTYLDTLA